MDEQKITVINLAEERSTRQQASSRCLLEAEYRQAMEAARPVDMPTAIRLLTPCLVLCSPSGMTQGDREEWLVAAYNALIDVPGSLFADACRGVMGACDHPAKIVPYIIRSTAEMTEVLQVRVKRLRAKLENFEAPILAAPTPRPAREPEPITQEEINDLPLFLRRSWLNLGMITQEQFDAAWRDGDEA
jgi:hypothetical protein